MKKSIWITMLAVTGFTLAAQAAPGGKEAAQALCQSLSFNSYTMKCTEVVQAARYFEPAAVQVCKDLSFPSQQIECLEKIKNKVYADNLIQTCKGMSFPSQITECMTKFGTVQEEIVVAPPPTLPPTVIITEQNSGSKWRIKKALKQLDKGNYYEVRRILLEELNDRY